VDVAERSMLNLAAAQASRIKSKPAWLKKASQPRVFLNSLTRPLNSPGVQKCLSPFRASATMLFDSRIIQLRSLGDGLGLSVSGAKDSYRIGATWHRPIPCVGELTLPSGLSNALLCMPVISPVIVVKVSGTPSRFCSIITIVLFRGSRNRRPRLPTPGLLPIRTGVPSS
jgi:hypothetical protein